MDMPKLLIADNGEEFRQSLAQMAGELCIVRSCSTGAQALELLHAFRPDILVVDLMLPELDGISLLHRMAAQELKPAVVAMSSFHSAYVSSTLSRLNVDIVLTKPCKLEAVVEHIRDLAAQRQPQAVTQADLQTASANLLLHLGFSAKLDGFGYLQVALPVYAADMSQAITKELYASVGKLYNKNARQVERSIRNAIEIAWKNRDDALWREYFPTPSGIPVPKPTNGAFISRMATQLTWIMGSYHAAM